MKLIFGFLFLAVAAQAATIVRKNEDLFPLSIIHLNDFHAR